MRQLTAERLRELLNYEQVTGLFTNRIQRGVRAPVGAVTGSYDKNGYIVIQINGQKFRAGRLAFLYMTGRWPIEVDHKNRVRDDDSWLNLRESTRSENVANSERSVGESGLRGVKFDPKTSTWRSRIGFGGYRSYVGGSHATREEAQASYLAAAKSVHGEFALHSRPQTPWRRI